MATKNELKLQKQIDEIKSDIGEILELIERVRNENREIAEKQKDENLSTKGVNATTSSSKRKKGVEQKKTNDKTNVNNKQV